MSKGANGKRIIWKAGDERPEGADAFETPLRKLVKSDEKRVVYGIVYGPGQVDSQGEYAERGEIEKAAYGFMKGLRLLNVDAQHDFDPRAAFVAESWLTKGADPLFPDEPEGSWAVGIRVEDEALWASVKKGELAGLSMAGYAAKVRKGEEGLLAKMEQLLARLLKAAEGAEAKNAQPGQSAEAEPGAGTPTGEAAAEAEAVAKIAKALEVPEDSEVRFIVRVRMANNKPVSIHESYIPYSLCKGLREGALANEQLCHIMENDFGCKQKYVNETFESVLATEKEAKLLGISKGYPLILMEEITRDEDKKVFEYTKIIFRGDVIKLSFNSEM